MILNYLNRFPVIRCTLLSIVLALLFGCSDSKYKPEVNPQPKYFMTVSGHVDTSLLKNLKFKFLTYYQSTNKKCEKDYSSFEGAYDPREAKHSFIIKPKKNGLFSKKIPLDLFQSGFCKWQISTISYITNDIDDDIIFFDNKLGRSNQKPEYILIYCKNGTTCQYKKVIPFKHYLLPKNNYNIKFFIKKKDFQ